MKIQKYQWGNSIEEWGSQWKERLQSSGESKVIQNMLDNTLGTNSFITKDGKLFNIDNPRIKYE